MCFNVTRSNIIQEFLWHKETNIVNKIVPHTSKSREVYFFTMPAESSDVKNCDNLKLQIN